jgi:hypothetical protein
VFESGLIVSLSDRDSGFDPCHCDDPPLPLLNVS